MAARVLAPAREGQLARRSGPVAACERGGMVLVAMLCCMVVTLTLLGVGVVYASMVASEHEGRMLPGTTVAGVDVAGMTKTQARTKVADELSQNLDRTITVRGEQRTWETTPRQLGSEADVNAAIAEAMKASTNATTAELVRLRWQGESADVAPDVAISHSREEARAFVNQIAEKINEPVRDAALNLEKISEGELEVVPGKTGQVVDTDAVVEELVGALREGRDTVDLTVHDVTPDQTVEDFRQVLVLRQDEHELSLYEDGRRVGTWTVAVGQSASGYPTPTGLYEITKKRPNPTWINPAPNGWGAGMPKRIGPGPNNPLGVRALNWSAPAIRFHGTANTSSIGTDASKGCVRLTNDDIVHVYDQVETGAKIVSLRSE